jgi:hypothetical protein
MEPSLLVHTLKGMLRSSDQQSICNVTQRVAGRKSAFYYINADVIDSSVIPHLEDGEYEFQYLGEPEPPVRVTREDGMWLNVPASTKTPARD